MTRFSALRASVVALMLVVTSAGQLVARDATPAAAAEGANLVAAYEQALNAHDAARVASLYADDAVVTQVVRDGNVFQGRAAITAWIAANLEGIPDLRVTTDAVIGDGDHIAWAWVYQGAYTGQYPDLPAGQGQSITLRGVSLLTLRNGLIVEEQIYFDNSSFLSQVGALPESGTTATPAA